MLSKTDFEFIKPYKDFHYWFKPQFIKLQESDSTTVTIIDKSTHESNIVAYKDINDYEDWSEYKLNRLEYKLYLPIILLDATNEELIHIYETLLMASTMVILQSEGNDPDSCIDHVLKCLTWIRTTDFYTCPSSTQYHDSVPGGLLYHTLKVAKCCQELYNTTLFNSVDYARAIRACLLHDWCKIGLYETYIKNVKDEASGEWKSEEAYRYKRDRMLCFGHGASSMYMAGKFFHLSYEEALAIRWHMGEFNVPESEMFELNQACRNYPMVYLLQFADRIACVEYL